MNASIINTITSTDDAVRRANVFSFEVQQPTLYMPQYVTVGGMAHNDTGEFPVVSFEIRDQYIMAVTHLVLGIELPEVKGVGRFAYIPYFGYKCIRHVSVTSVNGTIWETSGEELFEQSRNNMAAMELSGFSHELTDISVGLTPNDTIKDATSVYVYIASPFDSDSTFSSLKLSDAKVTVTVSFQPISDVIVHDAAFDLPAFKRSFIYSTELSFIGYMVRNMHAKPSYIEIPRRQVGQINQPTAVITDVFAATSLTVYVKPLHNDNKFIAYPGFSQSEASYVHVFVDRLLEDLVTISEGRPTCFPPSAVVLEVPESGIVSIQDVEVLVKIDNVPECCSVYYHANLLIFGTRKNACTYNLSKKFSVITGTYSAATNRIIFTRVSHSVSVTDASIPVSCWVSPKNVYHGDNRSDSSRAKDLFVGDPFLKGIDFLNKTEVISRLEVRYGNDVMYSENAPVSKVYSSLIGGQPSSVRRLVFNFNPGTYFRHTTLTATPSRGKDKVSVRALYASFDHNNPICYVPKQLVVVCTDLHRVSYDPYTRVSKISE